jgi:hypothetical protein
MIKVDYERYDQSQTEMGPMMKIRKLGVEWSAQFQAEMGPMMSLIKVDNKRCAQLQHQICSMKKTMKVDYEHLDYFQKQNRIMVLSEGENMRNMMGNYTRIPVPKESVPSVARIRHDY